MFPIPMNLNMLQLIESVTAPDGPTSGGYSVSPAQAQNRMLLRASAHQPRTS